MSAISAVVFDLDGTLVDSLPDLQAALNRLLATRGLAPLSVPRVREMVGDGAKRLVERAFAARGLAAGVDELADFLADYEANCALATRVYPGIPEALQTLAAQGHKLAVCTNKPAAATRNVLDALGLAPFFGAVVGGDSTPYRKPDPRHLAQALSGLIPIRENADWYARGVGGAAAREIKALYQPATWLEESINWRAGINANSGVMAGVMVGDHANDILAARGLAIPSIFVTWGYGQEQYGEERHSGVRGDFTANEAGELPGIIAEITRLIAALPANPH